jgi:hypothetical protein
MQTLDWKRFEAGAIGLSDPMFGTYQKGILAQDGGISEWHLGKRQGSDPRTFARLARVADRVGSRAGAVFHFLHYVQILAQRPPSLDKH